MQWYYIVDGEQCGPVEEGELRRLIGEGRVGEAALVWNETMGSEWRRVSEVPGLLPDPAAPEAPGPARAPGEISCTDPIHSAWDRMKLILFAPFDIKKWFILGFTAFLAQLSRGGGGSYNFRAGGGRQGPPHPSEWIGAVRGFFDEHADQMMLFATIAVIVVLVVLALGLLFLWLSSRGRFMFLDNVVNDRVELKRPWTVFANHGNSLFFWLIGFYVLSFVVFAVVGALLVATVLLPWADAGPHAPPPLGALALCGVAALALSLVYGLVHFALEHFVVPIMYINDLTAREAWGRFLGLLRGNGGHFFLYLLMYIVLFILSVIVRVIVLLPLCCLLWCFFLIPLASAYLLAVAFLPIHVFFRQYSLDYLAQYGPGFRAAPEAASRWA